MSLPGLLVCLSKQLCPEVVQDLTPRPAMPHWGQPHRRGTLLHANSSKTYSIIQAAKSTIAFAQGCPRTPKKLSIWWMCRGDPFSISYLPWMRKHRKAEAQESRGDPSQRLAKRNHLSALSHFPVELCAPKTKRQAALCTLSLAKMPCRTNASRHKLTRAPGHDGCVCQGHRASSPG